MTTQSILNLFGVSTPIHIAWDGKVAQLFDGSGRQISLPDGVSINYSTNQLIQGGEVVGNIQGFDFWTPEALKSATIQGTTTSQSTGGSASSPLTSNTDKATSNQPTLSADQPINGIGTSSGRNYATATLADGGARNYDPAEPVEPTTPTEPSDPGSDGSGGGSGGGGGGDPSGGDPETNNNDNEENNEENTDDGYDHGDGEDLTDPDDSEVPGPDPSILGGVSAALSLLQFLSNKGAIGRFFAQHPWMGKTLGAAGIVVGAWGSFASAASFWQDKSTKNAVSLIFSGFSFMSSWVALGNIWATSIFASTGIGAAILAGIVVAGLLYGKKKKDNKLDAQKADAAKLVNAQPWYSTIPNQNVFMIVSGLALMSIGIDLSVAGPAFQSIPVKAVELPGVRDALKASIDSSKRLPYNPEGLLGKVFIQSSGNNGVTKDKIVYIDKDDTTENGYRKNMISLSSDGKVVSQDNPRGKRVSFFEVNSRGAIVPTKDGSSHLSRAMADAQAANADGISPRGARGAVEDGALMGGRERASGR